MKWIFQLLIIYYLLLTLSSCSVQKQIARSAKENVLSNKALQTAHVGISIFEPAENKYWFNYQGDKYFVPASNTKLPTCYAAMKYLGDSLVGLRYGIPEEKWFKENVIVIQPTGDPTFLHEDFVTQPAFKFLQNIFLKGTKRPGFLVEDFQLERWGDGWSWNDYEASYMAERSRMPVFGNTISIKLRDTSNRLVPNPIIPYQKIAKPFTTGNHFFDSLVNGKFAYVPAKEIDPKIKITRSVASNEFRTEKSQDKFKPVIIPFFTDDWSTVFSFLGDTLKKELTLVTPSNKKETFVWENDDGDITVFHIKNWGTIHSQPTDSLLKPMMHHSDNFFAEQSLLMVSNEMLGVMNDEKIIDTLLKTDFKDLPQKPRWVDGSGLSRYNLFTPQDFVAILNKMKNEFGMERIKVILPTGGEGTISSYYKADSGYIYGKTGTLSGVVAFSGFLYTKKGKLLIFSTLVNNHQASATEVRRAMEKFLEGIRNNY
jgi:serine-type D-Ala-D-Ala carboxypeptidase/endopeptidase (penicillin-binding protein 4)